MQPKVVALGGGHGLAATLSALRPLTSSITAIVTVADNGGSSGRLRQEFDILPPGDLRMALAALCSDDEWGRSWAQILQYRFSGDGYLSGHPIGNLLLASLWDRDGDFVTGLDRVGSLLRVIGRVLPMSTTPLDIEGTFITSVGRVVVRGQKEVATAKGKLESLRILPEDAPARPETLEALADADWITMGPGSWLSSVLPHLLVPAQCQGLVESSAGKIVLLNLDAHPSQGGDEYAGYAAEEHLELMQLYAPSLRVKFLVADPSIVRNRSALERKAADLGARLIIADVRQAPGSVHHDEKKLTSVLSHIMSDSLIG